MEKQYTFQWKEEGKKDTTVTVAEGALTKPQKEQLLLELVVKWDNTPAECQHHFVEMLTERIKEVKKEGDKATPKLKLHKP